MTTRQQAVQRLFALWMVSALLLSGGVAIQVVAGKYGEDSTAAWSWLLAIVVPEISILGVAAFAQPTAAWKKAPADKFKYRCALWGSLVLTFLAAVTLLLEPLVEATPFEIFDNSGVLFALAQGLVLAAVGAVVFDKR